MLLINTEKFFEHPEEKVCNSNLSVGKASPGKLCLGLKVKRGLQVGRRVRATQAVWEYKIGKGLKVHPFYFPYYQNQPGQNYIIYLSKNKNILERKSF